jgi:pimeloyl-ACP methyl ester carboxylesterase
VVSLEAQARRETTRFAGGAMVWRVWGAGAPLVLLHGASGSWTHWIRNIGALAARLRVYVPDMPGFGDSDALPEPHTAERLAEAVAAGLERLVPGRFDLGGFSFGAIVAGHVAARFGSRVRTLVLFGVGGLDLPREPTRPLRPVTPSMTREEVEGAHRENLGILMLADPASIDDLAVRLQIDNVARARFRSGDIPTSDAFLRALPAIQARIVAIFSTRDAFVGSTLEARRRLLATRRPDLDFRVLDGPGHWAIYEAAPQATAMLLEALSPAESPPSARRSDGSAPVGDASRG